jgi:hypothetical protein
MDLVSEDALHMRTLAATLESIRRRRDANLQELCKSIIDLFATAEGNTLVGHVFASQEEFATWFKFAKDFVGTERAVTPEGSSRVDLEELASRFPRVEPSPVAGPSSHPTRLHSPTPHSLIPPIAVDSPDAPTPTNSQVDEDLVFDQLAGDLD